MGIDALVSLISLLAPKAFDLVSGLFHKKDAPDEVLATLANTKPEALSQYVSAQAALIQAQNASVNSDVAGPISPWVSNIRSLIRPFITVFGVGHIAYAHVSAHPVPDAAMNVYEAAICSWFGDRLRK